MAIYQLRHACHVTHPLNIIYSIHLKKKGCKKTVELHFIFHEMVCTRNTSNLWKDTRENTSKTCKRHMGDTWWSDTMKHININKYWYHSLCSPYDDRYFSGMVQKKCASSQELCMGPKQFFCQTEKIVEPRAFLIGVSNAATIRLSSLEFSRRQ